MSVPARSLIRMSPSFERPGSVRPAAEVNEDIRTLMLRGGGRLRAEDRPVYEWLVAEWTVATAQELACGGVVKAA